MKKNIDYSQLVTEEEFDKAMGWSDEEIAQIEAEAEDYIRQLRLKEKRKLKKMTQKTLAEKARLPRSTVARIESGKANPTIENLRKISNALDFELEINLIPKNT